MAEFTFNIDNTALSTINELELSANWEEMEVALSEIIAPYKNMVVTKEDLPDAKTDLAKLRKVFKNIDDMRKRVKKVYTAPLDAFERKCKGLTAICEEAINNLDMQVKEYQARAKAEKIQLLTEYFDNAPKKYPEYIRFEQTVNPKWTNATYSIETAQQEIDDAIYRSDNNVAMILSLEEEYRGMMLDEYKRTGSLEAAIEMRTRLVAVADAKAKVMRAEEAKSAQKAEPIPEAEPEPEVQTFKGAKEYSVVCTSQEEEEQLVNFCAQNRLSCRLRGFV